MCIFMYIDSVLHNSTNSTKLGRDVQMDQKKKENLVPDDIPIIWVNIV